MEKPIYIVLTSAILVPQADFQEGKMCKRAWELKRLDTNS